MPDPIKRLNYFDHQFLHVEDFTDEQSYHREMRRLHNQLLHTWGVCTGLQLSYPAGATVATVSTGTAIDGRGQQIVLTDNTNTPDISNLPGAAGHQVYVTIMYAEQQSDTSSETGTTGNRRVTEAPVIEVMTQPPSDPSLHVILGRVTVGSDGRLTGQPDAGASPTIRRAAGAVGGNLEVTSLTLGSASVDPSTWPSLRVGAPNQANLNGSLAVSGNLGVAGGVSVAGTLAVTAAAQLGRLLVGSTDTTRLTNALSVSDTTGIRQNSLYLSGAPGWSSLTYNAYHAPANDQWIFPDPSQTALTLEIDNQHAGHSRFQVFSTTVANKTAFVERLNVDGESGNITLGLGAGGNLGIGTPTPGARLDVVANATTAGGWFEAIRLSQPAHSAITHPGGGLLFGLHGDRHFYFADIAGGTFRRYLMSIDGNTGNVSVMAGSLVPSGQTATSGVVGLASPVGVNVTLPAAAVVAGQGRLHIAANELLYLLTTNGVVVGKEWGGTGNLTVEGTLSAAGGVAQEDWHAVTFQNGWRNYANGYAGAAYRKDALGVVHVRGLIAGGTTGWANGTAFNLPPGDRPAERLMFVAICGENWGVTRCDVDAAGNVWIGPTETPGSSGNTWFTLTTVNFRADQ